MAVTLDTALGNGNAAASLTCTMTTSAPVAAGGLIVLVAGRFSGSGSTLTASITTLGAMTSAHTLQSGSIRTSIFHVAAPAGLASGATITVTASGGANDFMIGAGSFLGVDTGVLVTGFNAAAASTAAWATGSVTANAGDLLVGGAFEDGSGTATSAPTGPAVELLDVANAGQSEAVTAAYKLSMSATDSVAGTWSTAVSHVAIGAAYKAASVVADVLPILLMTPPAPGG